MNAQQENSAILVIADEHAFKLVFENLYDALVRYAFTFLKDSDEAEDIVQLQFVKLWEKRAELTIHTSVKAFMYSAIYNACINKLKQQQVRQSYAKEVQLYATNSSSADELQHKELEQKIEQALQVLPEQCAKIFKMSRFEHLKYKEIADELNLSIKTIENQMGKALKILREQLKDYLPLLVLLLNGY